MYDFAMGRFVKPLLAGFLSLNIMAGLSAPAISAPPLYKDTMTMAGLFPWASNWEQSIARTKALGFTRGRMDFLWTWVEKSKGTYSFTFYDKVYNTMVANGLKPVFIIAYNNTLYGPSNQSGDQAGISLQDNRDAFARFASAAAAHFKGKGVIWEVWNEPDMLNFWYPAPSPTDFALLAQAAVQGIRQGDPAAYVTSAGFGHDWWDRTFVQQAMAAGMLNGYNAVGVHGYDFLNPPMGIEQQEGLYTQMRQWMTTYNGGKILPILDTEHGARTSWQMKVSGDPVDYAAKQTIRMHLDNYYSGVFMSSPYGMNATDELGLTNDSQVTKALTYTNTLLGNSIGANLSYGTYMRGIMFTNQGTGQKIIAWWPTKGQQTLNLTTPLKIKGAYNVYGQQKAGAGNLTSFTGSEAGGPTFFVLR